MEDDYENNRLDRKVSMVGWLWRNNKATCRPACSCCGGSQGIRRAWRHPNNSKPKRKDHRR
jgi:hypothetical protein